MADAIVDISNPSCLTSFEDLPSMTFSSSPVQYPPSSSPGPVPVPKQKRKLFQTLGEKDHISKRLRVFEDIGSDGQLDNSVTSLIDLANDSEQTVQHQLEQSSTLQLAVEPICADIDDLEPLQTTIVPNPLDLGRGLRRRHIEIKTNSGQSLKLPARQKQAIQTYEQIIADRSVTATGRARRAYYGIHIHELVDDAKAQLELDRIAKEAEAQESRDVTRSIERPDMSSDSGRKQSDRHQMWTEKYRAKKFTDLVGDERTHRSVLKWLKAWDAIVFPNTVRIRPKKIFEDKDAQEPHHRKIMLLTGPPGLGKTTLAHVCAKQAGYEVLEINASDDRSRDVVKGRIKDALGTETVRGIKEAGKARRAGRPVCVVVDEVDGVVTGSGGNGGEGGFMKALIDLVQLDQKNCSQMPDATGKKKKGDKFKLLRPLILICNDLYAPSLRLLRSSGIAEIVHVRKPPLEKVVARLKSVFEKENIHCENDAVRRLCESSWGLGTRKQGSGSGRGAGDGDIRSVLVHGEWMAHKLRVDNGAGRLTRKWVEGQIINSSSSKGHKGLGRGGVREVVERIFIEGAGLPASTTTLSADEKRQITAAKSTQIGVADLRKRSAINALREMIDTTGDHDKLMVDCFATYPTQVFQDDTFLSKPCMSYDWLYFHDSLSSRIFSGQEWELNPYLNTSACAFHSLFASVDKGATAWSNQQDNDKHDSNEEDAHPFSGAKADYAAYEAQKQNHTVLTELQSTFSGELLRMFSSTDVIAAELIPNVNRMLAPDVKPVVVGGSGGGPAVASVRKESERNCVSSVVRVMSALNVQFEMVKIETEGYTNSTTGGYAYRMEPPLDTLSTYHFGTKTTTSNVPASAPTTQPTRYAIRQVLDQELRKAKILQASMMRQARGNGAPTMSFDLRTSEESNNKENIKPGGGQELKKPTATTKIVRDFFGRPVASVITLPEMENVANIKLDASSIAKSTATKGKARGGKAQGGDDLSSEGARIWVSFNEGFSNAVRKPITLADLMDGF